MHRGLCTNAGGGIPQCDPKIRPAVRSVQLFLKIAATLKPHRLVITHLTPMLIEAAERHRNSAVPSTQDHTHNHIQSACKSFGYIPAAMYGTQSSSIASMSAVAAAAAAAAPQTSMSPRGHSSCCRCCLQATTTARHSSRCSRIEGQRRVHCEVRCVLLSTAGPFCKQTTTAAQQPL
jgi:hypothetical protein